MAAKATRCPHCQTSFRVTEAQLATARGLVRCGACLEVFNAQAHWVESEPAPEPTSAQSSLSPDDDIRFDDDNGFPDDEPAETLHSPPPPVENNHQTPVDESEPADFAQEVPDPEAPEQYPEAPDEDTSTFINQPPTATQSTTREDAIEAEATNQLARDRADDDFSQLVSHRRQQLRISRQQLGWTLLSLVAGLCLIGQLLYINFDALAQSAYRPKMQSLCNVINFFGQGQHCSLPPAQNLALIYSRGLNIYSHPTFANSLLVDALIENQAVFDQPFPIIELEFRDQNGRPVASRRFEPAEYLAGELRDMAFMPSRQTVHINISILDPGSTAVNYEMLFHPADSGS